MNVEDANREELLNALYTARSPLIDINNLQVQISNNENLMYKNKNGISIKRIIKAALFGIVGFLIAMFIVAVITGIVCMSMGKYYDSLAPIILIPFLVPVPLCIALLIIWKNKRLKENQQLAIINQNLQEQIKNIFMNCSQILDWIPNKYCNYYTVRDLIQILENYRASNFQELANTYEQDVYNKRIIQGQEEIKAQQMNIAIMNAMQQTYNAQKISDAVNYGKDFYSL